MCWKLQRKTFNQLLKFGSTIFWHQNNYFLQLINLFISRYLYRYGLFWFQYILFIPAIQCPPPLPPMNGRLLDNGHYLVGNTVQYFCSEGFVLIGEPVIRCTESGLWSHAPPFCKFTLNIKQSYLYSIILLYLYEWLILIEMFGYLSRSSWT